MRPPRRLSTEEAAVWRRVAETVTPLQRARPLRKDIDPVPPVPDMPLVAPALTTKLKGRIPPARPEPPKPPALPRGDVPIGLDASWERKIARGGLDPDFSLDLHGAGLDQAYSRLMHGLAQARALGARVVLVVTGKPRPTEAADRGQARGAIRAKIIDWLGASEHAGSIAAIRGAHRRHGGPGALYVVLKRRR